MYRLFRGSERSADGKGRLGVTFTVGERTFPFMRTTRSFRCRFAFSGFSASTRYVYSLRESVFTPVKSIKVDERRGSDRQGAGRSTKCCKIDNVNITEPDENAHRVAVFQSQQIERRQIYARV